MYRSIDGLCIICRTRPALSPAVTCSIACHEELVRRLIEKFGEYKKVVRAATGEAFRVPTRVIIEQGIREEDLDRYPRWKETN